MWFSCFCVLPGSAEAKVISRGIVKRLLVAYFIGNISAKKYQNPFMWAKVISKPKVGRFFWDTVYIHFQGLLTPNGILAGAKFTLRPSLAFTYFGSVLQGTWALVVRQTRNGITELSQTAPSIWQGSHHAGHRPTFLVLHTKLPCSILLRFLLAT